MERRNGGRDLNFYENLYVPDAASYFLCINCFNSQDNAVKSHYYKLHFIDKEMDSRVVKSFQRVTSLSGSHN